jgi:CRP-like cAMP-binding protein
VVYFGGALSILTFVFGIPIGTLVATSGLVAIIVGLALQSTLNDVFSGIALTLGRPYVIGNWITLTDGTEGRVIESTWRATHILTGANNVVVLPNSLLARLGVTNVSRPDETHLLTVTIRVSPTHVPSFVMEVMQTVLLSCRTIIAEPRPIVTLKTLDALALELELQFRVASPAERLHARSEVLDLVYRHCRSVGLLLALPPDSIVAAQPAQKPNRNSRPQPIDLLETISIFTTLTHDEKLSLAAAASIRQFRKGDVIVQQGDLLPALMIIGTGVIVMHRDDKETGRLAPGDFFGEAGLFAGMGEVCTLRALTPVTVHEFDQYAVAPLLAKRPALADELAVGLSERSPQSHSTMPETPRHDHRAHIFRDAIQRLFHVPQ